MTVPGGTCLLETVRLRDGTAPLWPLHLARLVRSCAALGMPAPAVSPPPRPADGVWRLEVGAAGVRETFREVEATTALALRSVAVVHPGYPHKTSDRAAFDSARREARRAGGDDALLLTPEGYVAECSIWSLLWWEPGGLAAPSLRLGVLPGVARARVGTMLGGLRERRLRPARLQGLSVLAANAVRGVVPVAEIDGVPVPEDPRTALLQRDFWG